MESEKDLLKQIVLLGGLLNEHKKSQISNAKDVSATSSVQTATAAPKGGGGTRAIRSSAPGPAVPVKRTVTRRPAPRASERSAGPLINVGGVLFSLRTDKAMLVRHTQTSAPASAPPLPKRVNVRGVIYQMVDANTYRKVEPKPKPYCMFFNKFGECKNGTACPYAHDKDKMAVCQKFLRGTCEGPCLLSHTRDPSKMPMCMFFVRGQCERGSECDFLHVQVAPDAPVCQDFVKGFCAQGARCTNKHTWDCPAWAETDACADGDQCRLRHPVRKTKPSVKARDAVAPRALRTATTAEDTQQRQKRMVIRPDFSGTIQMGSLSDERPDIANSQDQQLDLAIRPRFSSAE